MPSLIVVVYDIIPRGDTMEECPYCAADLNGPTHRITNRTDADPGRKSPGQELVSCPNCGGVIDGFTAH